MNTIRCLLFSVIGGCLACSFAADGWSNDLGAPSTWTMVGPPPGMRSPESRAWSCICKNAAEKVDGFSDDQMGNLVVDWSRRGFTDADRKRDEASVEKIVPKIQDGIGSFIVKWRDGGNNLKGRPWCSSRKNFNRSDDDADLMWRIKSENCRRLLLMYLARNKAMLKECEELPLEWIVERLHFPDPRYEESDGKNYFRMWASLKIGKQLTTEEFKTLFGWQFYVVEKEKRPWMDIALAVSGVKEHPDFGHDANDKETQVKRRGGAWKFVPKQFSDFLICKKTRQNSSSIGIRRQSLPV